METRAPRSRMVASRVAVVWARGCGVSLRCVQQSLRLSVATCEKSVSTVNPSPWTIVTNLNKRGMIARSPSEKFRTLGLNTVRKEGGESRQTEPASARSRVMA